ncbi:hypothetical protein [Nocardioides marmoraquaticus]
MRLTGSVAVALLGPVVAWVVWVLPFGGQPPDAWPVAWFVTVAVGALLAGWLAPSGGWSLAAVSVVAVLATLAVLWAWWSATDDSGLFVIGFAVALPLVVVGGPALVAAGRGLRTALLQRAAAAPGR